MLKDFTRQQTIKDLKSNEYECMSIEKGKGVYVVIANDTKTPKFINPGSGGFFKGRDPNVEIKELEENWVKFSDKDDKILYIEKAGDKDPVNEAILRKRVRAFMKFGDEKPTAHRGGKSIWQLDNTNDLMVLWKFCEDPEGEKTTLLNEFKKKHNNRLPFANKA